MLAKQRTKGVPINPKTKSMKAKIRLGLVMASALIAVQLSAAEMALQILHEFFPDSGPSYTYGPLIEDIDGTFISISRVGGLGYGTVYRISRDGSPTLLHSFDGSPS